MKGDDYALLSRELIHIGTALTSIRRLDRLLDMIVTEARRFTRSDAASIYVVEDGQLRFTLTQNETLSKRLGDQAFKELFQTFLLPINTESVAGYVATTGDKVTLDDAYDLPPGTPYTIDRTFDERNDYRTASMLVVPMKDRSGDVIGVLQLINSQDSQGRVVPFDRDIADLADALASQAASAIRNAQLTEELRRVHFRTIVRLARAAEYRDTGTGNHIERVSHYCAAIARRLGWSEDRQELLKHATVMHDVGKIAIPDELLLKPGRFTDEERARMERHPALGGEILANPDSEVIEMAQIVALSHHERWDGNGYPAKLKGKDIPECGRICAVSDVFDALMTKRPYKDPMPLDKVLSIIREDTGSHFDPEVTEAFFASLDEILDIREIYKDSE